MLTVITKGRGAIDALRFLAAFAVMTAYWPGISGAGTSPRWALLAFLLAPILFVGPRIKITALHVIGMAFVAWAFLTVARSDVPLDAVDAGLKLVILACAFCVGGQIANPAPLYCGAALGMGISSIIAVAQISGYWQFADLPHAVSAGLFVNRLMLAEAAALIGIALLASRMWCWLSLVLPALILPLERAPVLAFSIVGAVSLWKMSRLCSIGLLVAGFGFVAAISLGLAPTQEITQGADRMASAMQRPAIWRTAIGALDAKGHGLGSFRAAAPQRLPGLTLDHAHNEFIEMAFETGGVGAMLFAAFWLATLWAAPRSIEAAIVFVLLMEACFAFPFHEPITGAMGALCAGHCSRALPRAVDALAHRRALLRERLEQRRRRLAFARGADIRPGYLPIRSSLS